MYEDDTTYVEVGLACNTKDDEENDMDILFDWAVPTPEANDNYMNASVMFARGKVMQE